MKLTVPHMGNCYIAFEALLTEMGHEVIIPPSCSKKTLSLGTKYSPETICLPMKINVGNFLEGLQLGAEAIVMIGGSGPCRLGYFAEVQKEILKDLGVEAELIVLEPPREGLRLFKEQIQRLAQPKGLGSIWRGLRLAWEKQKAIEALENASHYARPREARKGATSDALASGLAKIRAASSVGDIRRITMEEEACILNLASSGLHPLKVGIVGEIYTILESFTNLDLDERLGYLGVELTRTVSVVSWVRDHIILNSFKLYRNNSLIKQAKGYLNGFVGGHGLETVASTVQLAEENYAGVVHLMPFTCMPEIVAQSVLEKVSRDLDIPILSLIVDEHTGEAGYQTRLEAFVDLLERRIKSGSEPIREGQDHGQVASLSRG